MFIFYIKSLGLVCTLLKSMSWFRCCIFRVLSQVVLSGYPVGIYSRQRGSGQASEQMQRERVTCWKFPHVFIINMKEIHSNKNVF